MLDVDISDVFLFEEEYERGLVTVSDSIRRAVRLSIDEGVREAINTRRYQDQTGLLTSRITGLVEVSTPGGAAGYFGAFTPYASFVEGGTKPHEIRGNPLLTFKTAGGQWVTTRLVQHPGTKPDGFMGRAFLKSERILIKEVELGVAQLQQLLDSR